MWGVAALDGACLCVAYLAATSVTSVSREAFPYGLVAHLPYLVLFLVVWAGAALDERLWSIYGRNRGLKPYLTGIMKAIANATVFAVFMMAIFVPAGLDRAFLFAFAICSLVGLSAFRIALHAFAWQVCRLGFSVRSAVIVGANDRTAELVEGLDPRGRARGSRVGGLVEDDPARGAETAERLGVRYLGPCAELDRLLDSGCVGVVYVTLPVRSCYDETLAIAEKCERAGVPAFVVAELFPVRIAASRLMYIDDMPLLSLSTIPETQARLAVKRFLDFVLSSILILVLSPVFVAVAILIKLDSRGPLIFAQERVGQNQRRFKMLKFRSMVVNAEELRKELERMNEADGPVFKIRRDPRITRVGRYIRRYSLDELPQLFNVWWGQMSLVGPRPPIPSEVEEYTWGQRRRLSVKPGMTGLWQVSGRSDIRFEEWVKLDLEYIDRWSLWLDLTILLRTFRAVVVGRGAA